jgi:hypothetical protein
VEGASAQHPEHGEVEACVFQFAALARRRQELK